MKVKIQQSNEEINSIGGISLIGGLFNSLKSLNQADSMQTSKIKTGKIKEDYWQKRMDIIGNVVIGVGNYKCSSQNLGQ